jgi:hypothetical protein
VNTAPELLWVEWPNQLKTTDPQGDSPFISFIVDDILAGLLDLRSKQS